MLLGNQVLSADGDECSSQVKIPCICGANMCYLSVGVDLVSRSEVLCVPNLSSTAS